ncbi:Pre-mRNA-splicing factor cwc26 [Ciborinia camelliae]|nr:Pre-mRNA-splicing factor cwc26 [Ciborinia camelliae]
MSLSSYLAKNYLTASSSSSSSTTKKRKRKAAPQSGLIIADDDAPGWPNPQDHASDEDTPMISNHSSSEFRKSKKSAWKTVGVPALQPQNDNVEADRIIQEAAAENSAALHQDEEPTIEENRGGLQTADAAALQFEKRKRDEAAQWARESSHTGGSSKNRKTEETVYRDATGRRIDISMRRSEAKKEMDEKARKELEEKEAQKGDVQLLAKAKRREELDEARFMTVARGVNDVEMNEELKEVERWNDPAMQFLSKEKKGKSKTGKPLYQGAAAPNRYGIRPGHRWDGVDRGNGWEAERFKGENRRARNKDLDFQWQMDT